MRAIVPQPDQADVPAPAENEMRHHEPLQSLPQAFRYNNEDVQNVFVVAILRSQCIHCNSLKCSNESAGICCDNVKIDLCQLLQPPQPLAALCARNSENSRHFQIKYANIIVPFSSLPLAARKGHMDYMDGILISYFKDRYVTLAAP